jgi:uncharacterized protein (UPF0218 family)
MTIRRLTPILRKKLKAPLGILIRGPSNITMKRLKKFIQEENPPKIISVGDVVSENMVKNDIPPQVLIVDNKVMRENIPPISVEVSETITVNNPPGMLTDELWPALQQAISQVQRTKIEINGEEDLVALVALSVAPEGSLVIYGQPREGIVVVKATKEKKKEIDQIIEEMEEISKEK